MGAAVGGGVAAGVATGVGSGLGPASSDGGGPLASELGAGDRLAPGEPDPTAASGLLAARPAVHAAVGDHRSDRQGK